MRQRLASISGSEGAQTIWQSSFLVVTGTASRLRFPFAGITAAHPWWPSAPARLKPRSPVHKDAPVIFLTRRDFSHQTLVANEPAEYKTRDFKTAARSHMRALCLSPFLRFHGIPLHTDRRQVPTVHRVPLSFFHCC